MTLRRSQSTPVSTEKNSISEYLLYPKLRNGIDPYLVSGENGDYYIGLHDLLALSETELLIPQDLFFLLQFFDGKSSLLEIRSSYMKKFNKFLFENRLQELVEKLDQAFLLDNPNTENRLCEVRDEYRKLEYREPICAGSSYPAEPGALAAFLEKPMHMAGKSIAMLEKYPPVKAIIAPHIDIRLGSRTFAHSYYPLLHAPHIDLFVILGIGHCGIQNLFALTEKNFRTPDGLVYTDSGLVKEIMPHSQYDFLAEELIHRDEHSIELQTVFLNHYFNNFKILPVLCSFQHDMFTDTEQVALFTDFVRSVKSVLSTYKGTVCYIASVDLAHVGVKYGDAVNPDKIYLAHVEQQDREILKSLAGCHQSDFQLLFKRNNDQYHICGYSALTTLMELMPKAQGTLLDYHSAGMDKQNSTVTFASMVFI